MAPGTAAIEYHERTKHAPETIGGGQLDFANKPRPDKAYVDLPTLALNAVRPEPATPTLQAITGPGSEEGPELDRASVLALCYYAAGITKTIRRRGEDRAFRAASCTGALYHIDLYPVCAELPDLPAGVYHYDPRDDVLERLRTGDYRGVLATASRHDGVRDAPVTVIATSTWWRNAWKYEARTYRHAFWDSGTVLANLLATAHASGWPASAVTGFADDRVASLLGIDPGWEAPLELVPIGGDHPVPESVSVAPIDPATAPLDSDPVEYPLIQEAWQASTLADGATAAEWRTARDRPVDGRGPGEGKRFEADPVDGETASNRPLHDTIHRRGSCRAYTREAISFRKLSTILDRSLRGVPMDVRSDGGPPLQFVDCYCLVTGVEDLPRGTYQYHPEPGRFEQLDAGLDRETVEYLALGQSLAGDAAVNLYFMTDLEAITDTLGDRGYRVAQLEAALAAGRLYLGTYAHRTLGGTGLTFFDDDVTEFLAPHAAGQTPMFLYTMGRPA